MGCGASSKQDKVEVPKRLCSSTVIPGTLVPSSLPAWSHLKCDEAGRIAMQAEKLSLEVASRLVEELGVRFASDLSFIQEADVQKLGLLPIDARKVMKLVQASKQELPLPSSPPQQHSEVVGSPASSSQPQAATPRDPITDADMPLIARGARQLKEVLADKEKLAELACKGLKYATSFLQQVGPLLPFPGGEAAELLCLVMDHTGKALQNKPNLENLKNRAVDLLTIVIERLQSVTFESDKAYLNIMGRFRDLLQEVEMYAKDYTNRNFFMRVVTSKGDSEQFTGYADTLTELTIEATFAITSDNLGVSKAIQSDVAALRRTLEEGLVYVDCGKPLRDAVERLGGIAAVLKDKDLMHEALQSADVGQQITAQMVGRAVKAAEAALDEGIHRNIKHRLLSIFWRCFYKDQIKITWGLWWNNFPSELDEVNEESGLAEQLSVLLSDEASRTAFQQAVKKEQFELGTFNIEEVMLSFPKHMDLVTRTKELLSPSLGSSSLPLPSAGSSASAVDPMSAGAGSKVGVVGVVAITPAAQRRFKLPGLDPLYCGRDHDAEKVQGLVCGSASPTGVQARGSYRCCVLLGGGGLGKSSLAIDVGCRMWRAGCLPAGAMMVDLRDAFTQKDVEGRFCVTLGINQEDNSLPGILNQLKSIGSDAGGHLLLVVDNAEDSLRGTETHALPDIIQRVISSSQHTLMLVTTRAPLPAPTDGAPQGEVTCFEVPPAQPQHMSQLVRKLANKDVLRDTEVHEVVEACGGVPLLTRMVADALANGRLDMTEVQSLLVHGADSLSDGQRVALMLQTLPRKQQRILGMLSVFPSTFDEEGAEAVAAGCMELLPVMYRHGLLLHDSLRGQYYLHMAVRQAAVELVKAADMRLAQEAFIEYMNRLLVQWAQLYSGTTFSLALSLTRGHAADLSALWALLSSQTGKAELVCNAVCVAKAADLDTEGVASLLDASGFLRDSLPAWQSIMAVTEGDVRHEVEYANAANMCCMCLRDNGKYEEAQVAVHLALTIQTRLLGAEHPSTLSSMNNMAGGLYAMGTYSEAEPIYRQVLQVHERVLGPEHPDTLSSISNMAICLDSMGKYSEAEHMYRQVLQLRERVLGPEHPDTLTSVSNMAGCLRSMGKYSEAEPMYRQVLQLREQVLGPEHPDTLTNMNNMAVCLMAMGKYSEAEPMSRQVVQLSERVLGPEHPDTLTYSSNMACCLKAMGQ